MSDGIYEFMSSQVGAPAVIVPLEKGRLAVPRGAWVASSMAARAHHMLGLCFTVRHP